MEVGVGFGFFVNWVIFIVCGSMNDEIWVAFTFLYCRRKLMGKLFFFFFMTQAKTNFHALFLNMRLVTLFFGFNNDVIFMIYCNTTVKNGNLSFLKLS